MGPSNEGNGLDCLVMAGISGSERLDGYLLVRKSHSVPGVTIMMYHMIRWYAPRKTWHIT